MRKRGFLVCIKNNYILFSPISLIIGFGGFRRRVYNVFMDGKWVWPGLEMGKNNLEGFPGGSRSEKFERVRNIWRPRAVETND